MAGITQAAGLDLGISDEIRSATAAYLVVVLEGSRSDRVDEDAEAVATLLDELGAIDVFVLPPTAGEQLIKARERAFFVAKAAGSNDIVDVVVPRAAIPGYLAARGDARHQAQLARDRLRARRGRECPPDGVPTRPRRPDPARARAARRGDGRRRSHLGRARSREAKAGYFLELGDPVVIALMQRLKQAFDPNGILGPGNLPGLPSSPPAAATSRGSHLGHGEPVSPAVNGAQLIISTLASNGVDVTFANPGTSEMHFVAALDTVPEMRGVLGLFEGVVTGAADGYARIARKPAATLLHLGPGLANGLANLHNARRAEHTDRQSGRRPRHLPQALRPATRIGHRVASQRRCRAGFTVARSSTTLEPTSSRRSTRHGARRGESRRSSCRRTCRGSRWSAAVGRPPGDTGERLRVLARRCPGRRVEGVAKALQAAGERRRSWSGGRRHVDVVSQRPAASLRRRGQSCSARRFLPCSSAAPASRRSSDSGTLPSSQPSNSTASRPSSSSTPCPPCRSSPTRASRATSCLQGARSTCSQQALTTRLAALEALADLVGSRGARAARAVAPRDARPAVPPPAPTVSSPRSVADAVGATLPEGRDRLRRVQHRRHLHVGRDGGCPPHEWMCLTGGAIGQGLPVGDRCGDRSPRAQSAVSLEADGSAMYTLQSWWTQARESLDVTTVILENRSYAILGARTVEGRARDRRARRPRQCSSSTHHRSTSCRSHGGWECPPSAPHPPRSSTSMLARSIRRTRTICDRRRRRPGDRITALTITTDPVASDPGVAARPSRRVARRRDAGPHQALRFQHRRRLGRPEGAAGMRLRVPRAERRREDDPHPPAARD